MVKKKPTKKKRKPKKKIFVKFALFKKLLLSNLSMTPTDAVIKAGYRCKDRDVAKVIASQNLTKLNVEMPDLMERMGLTDEEDFKDLKRLRKAQKLHVCDIYIKKEKGKYKINTNSNDFIEVDDNQAQLKALELTAKFKGRLINKTEHSGKIDGGEMKLVIIRADEKKEKKPKKK